MDNNIEKRIQSLRDRLTYMQDIFAGKHKDNADLLEERLTAFAERARSGSLNDPYAELATVEVSVLLCGAPSGKQRHAHGPGAHRASSAAYLPARHPGKRLRQLH